ncbi:hypothetical protein MAPG_11575 [Magnaporthiopsis poae ATCC 64411]|uniref:Uncharacterized protein n=1 Tax=Magnaporthiopsis poae (strain ATCC 64411 / 73-15) TaxID=644358 RepID=A0A0C4EFM3_MAGP6|nr:hypothetical protein MAPG_11575 [Magnaporthiopsis poae ATCC 64411]
MSSPAKQPPSATPPTPRASLARRRSSHRKYPVERLRPVTPIRAGELRHRPVEGLGLVPQGCRLFVARRLAVGAVAEDSGTGCQQRGIWPLAWAPDRRPSSKAETLSRSAWHSGEQAMSRSCRDPNNVLPSSQQLLFTA